MKRFSIDEKYEVEVVERFDDKNNAIARSRWDPILKQLGRDYYGPNPPRDKPGYTLKDMALRNTGWYMDLAYGYFRFLVGKEGPGLYKRDGKVLGPSEMVSGLKLEVTDPAQMSRDIKRVGRYLGASLVGIAELDRRWLYSHNFHLPSKDYQVVDVPEEYKYAIVLALQMPYQMIKASPTYIAATAEGMGYSLMAVAARLMAHFIWGLGYKAIPSGNDTAISVPLGVQAGLGELGRNGILITPQFGPRVRLCKVFTDLPLATDSPMEFGVTEFCEKCKKCAQFCHSQAISYGERTKAPVNASNYGGVLKWPVNHEKCLAFWAGNKGSCATCIRVCPFNKTDTLFHSSVRWLVDNTRWADLWLRKADDFFGYGKQADPTFFWKR